MTFSGSCNRDLFEYWLVECLVPQLQPGDIIVIDNASFHRSQTIEEILAEVGCEIWYLPPYPSFVSFQIKQVVNKSNYPEE